MESFLLNAPCLYYAATDHGVVVEVNAMLCHQLGYEKEELIGQKMDLFYTIASRIFQQTHFFPLVKLHGHAEEIYLTLQTKSKKVLPVIINAQRCGEGEAAFTSFVGIIVHNRKKFEDELVAAKKAAEAALQENSELTKVRESLQAQAEQLDHQMGTVKRQNEELKQFNRVVTHDLQEPLRKLSVYANMIMETENIPSGHKAVEKIATAAANLRSILTGLQQYVWLMDTEPAFATIDLNKEVELCTKKIKEEHPDVEIEVTCQHLPSVMADREQLLFLFNEVFTNAVRFRKEDKGVHIIVSGTVLLQNQFRTIADKYKYIDAVKLEIRDNGVGMDSRYQNQALDLFRRLHPVSGRGVGLSLCKKIVENHSGTLFISSTPGVGTVVTIWLPLLSAEQNTASPHNTSVNHE